MEGIGDITSWDQSKNLGQQTKDKVKTLVRLDRFYVLRNGGTHGGTANVACRTIAQSLFVTSRKIQIEGKERSIAYMNSRYLNYL